MFSATTQMNIAVILMFISVALLTFAAIAKLYLQFTGVEKELALRQASSDELLLAYGEACGKECPLGKDCRPVFHLFPVARIRGSRAGEANCLFVSDPRWSGVVARQAGSKT